MTQWRTHSKKPTLTSASIVMLVVELVMNWLTDCQQQRGEIDALDGQSSAEKSKMKNNLQIIPEPQAHV